MKTIRKEHVGYLICILFSLCWSLWLTWQIPYTHDDWSWGTSIGLTHLLTADINSRFAGNLVEVLLTRSPVLKTLVMGLVLTGIPALSTEAILLMENQDRNQSKIWTLRTLLFALSFLTLLTMPDSVWAQCYGWVAGFSNFVVSALLMILYFVLAFTLLHDGVEQISTAHSILLIFFGVAIQLFIENLSLFFFLVTFVLILYLYRRSPSSLCRVLALPIGIIVGTAFMFSSGIYRSLLATGQALDSVRLLSFDRKAGLLDSVVRLSKRLLTIFPETILCSVNIFALLFVLLGLYALCRRREHRAAALAAALGDLALSVFLAYAFVRLRHVEFETDTPFMPLLPALFWGCVIFISVQLICFFRHDAELFLRIMAFWVAPFLILAPLAVVDVISPRSYFTGNVCTMLLCMQLAVLLVKDWNFGPLRFAARLSVAALLLLFVYWSHIYAAIGTVKKTRDELLAFARVERPMSIVLPDYPYRQYLCGPNPVRPDFEQDFRRFYEVPMDCELIFE